MGDRSVDALEAIGKSEASKITGIPGRTDQMYAFICYMTQLTLSHLSTDVLCLVMKHIFGQWLWSRQKYPQNTSDF